MSARQLQGEEGAARDVPVAPPTLLYVSLRLRGPRPSLLLFNPRLTVLRGFHASIAEDLGGLLVAATAPDGRVEIDGEQVSLADLPPADRSPERLDAAILRRDLRRFADRARSEVEDGFAALLKAAREIEAGRQAVVRRLDTLEREIERALHHEIEAETGVTDAYQTGHQAGVADAFQTGHEIGAAPAAGPAVGDGSAGPDDDTGELERLLAEVEATRHLPPVPHPDAEPLADELAQVDEAIGALPSRPELAADLVKWERILESARVRLEQRRAEARRVDRSVLAEAAGLRDELANAELAARRLFASRRKRERREEARGALTGFLAGFGVSSYGELAVLAAGRDEDSPASLQAAAAVESAEVHCAELRRALTHDDRDRLLERRATLLRQARALLEHDPGPHLPEALRDHRVAPPEHAEALAALTTALRERGVDAKSDPEEAARTWLARQEALAASRVEAPATEDGPRLPEPAAPQPAVSARAARLRHERDYERLTAELEDLDLDRRSLENCARQIDVETLRGRLDALSPRTVELLLGAACRPECPDEPARPLIVDDVFTDLAPRTWSRGFEALVRAATRRQVILVTGRAEVVALAHRLPPGGVSVLEAEEVLQVG